HGSAVHTDVMKTQGLKQALDLGGYDAAIGGARRDEEKSRAKERIFSFRNGESVRVFPISNLTELDVWLYIYREKIPVVPLYFAKERPVVERDGTLLLVDDDRLPMRSGETPISKKVRF